jgi:HK97 family phage prohead protease
MKMAKPTQAWAEQTRDVPALSLRAQVQPATLNEESRTVELIWTTGARVLRGFFESFWEELSLDPKHVRMDRLNNGAPLLDSHDGSSGVGAILGVVESARLEKGRGTAVVRFAKDDPAADAAWNKVRQGILQNVSVGYRIYKAVKTDESTDKVPVVRVEDWEPYELSMVPMGADDGAGVRSVTQTTNPCIFASASQPGAETMAEKSEKSESTAAAPAAAVVEATRAAAEKRERTSEANAAASARATEQAVREEREREVEIRSIVRASGLGDELADKLITDGATLNDVRAAALNHLTSRSDASASSGHSFSMGEDQREKFIRGGVASIMQRAGLAPMIAAAKKSESMGEHLSDVATDPGEFRGMKLADLARAALERAGQSTRGLHGEQLVKRALQFRGDAGMNTTSDFATLLETAVNKSFLGAYAITPTTWRRWCAVKSVQDFRTSTFYRPGSFGVLDSVSEGGEVKHKNIPDGSKATLTPSTKGNIIGITRRAIVNDDLGVFRDLAAMLGQAAALTVESDAFALITVNSGLGPTQSDSQPLFHANRANIGATGAMSVTTWDSAASIMAVQKDVSGNNILGLTPSVWLGPAALRATAMTLNKNTSDPTVNKSSGVANPVQGMVQDVVATGRLTGTRHYFIADPSLAPVFAVGFIDGQEAPRIDSEQSFEYDGVQWRIILDYGVAVLDYRGAVTAAGA